jgi:hypothetical protein
MKSLPVKSHLFEFCFPHLDYTLLQVEEDGGEVIIRATANTFSEQRKTHFVRELAAEGFIPDEYRWWTLAGSESYLRGVRWIVDPTWLELDEALMARNRRWALRLLPAASVLWLLLIGITYPL